MPGQMYQYALELEAMHLTRVPAWFAEILNLGLHNSNLYDFVILCLVKTNRPLPLIESYSVQVNRGRAEKPVLPTEITKHKRTVRQRRRKLNRYKWFC